MAEELEGGHPLLVTTHHLAIDQTGPHLEVVHGLNHERGAGGAAKAGAAVEACDALLPGAGPGLIPRDVGGMISLPIRLTGQDHLMAALLCGLSGKLHFLMRAVSSITLTCSRAVT